MNQDTVLKISFAVIFGITMVLFEKWYSKYRTKKIKAKGLTIIPKFSFKKSSDDHSDYEREYNNYAISLNHIRKNSLFSSHSLRLLIDFTPPTSFANLQDFIENERKKHPKFNWVGNSVFRDIQFTNLNENVMENIELHLNEITSVLISEKIQPISRNEGRLQGEAFENWQETAAWNN